MCREWLQGSRAGVRGLLLGALSVALCIGTASAQYRMPSASSGALRVEPMVQPDNTPDEFVRPKDDTAVHVAPFIIDLGPWTQDKVLRDPEDGPEQIGAKRASAITFSVSGTRAALQWQTSARGGLVAAMSFESHGALGMRIGLLIDKLPGNAILRLYSQDAPGDVFQIAAQRVIQMLDANRVAGDLSDAGRTWWTPGVAGDELTLEIELPPGIATSLVQVSVPSVMHFFEEMARPDPQGAVAQDTMQIGESSYCQKDATCFGDLETQRNAVARMIFVKPEGAYVCTGTLVNDANRSGTPYFLTAHHCIGSQTVASTLQTYWFYRSSVCNAATLSPASRTLKNGAMLLHTAEASDVVLLRLNDTPPPGAVFAGWDANPMSLNSPVVGVHHPRGDLLKLSAGNIEGASDCVFVDADSVRCRSQSGMPLKGNYYRIKWAEGTTEGGSSGSALFRDGVLTGIVSSGTGSCLASQAYTNYARFDVVFPALKQWLAPPQNDAASADASTRAPVYRFFNTATGAHFYTVNVEERDYVIQNYSQFQYENVAFYAYAKHVPGTDPVFRFYGAQSGAHFYTISPSERDYVVQNLPAFRLEGPVWYAQTAEGHGASPIFRFYNPRTGAHFYTVSASERDFVLAENRDFHYEGPVYHVWTTP